MVGPEIDYVKVKDKSGKFYVLAEARLKANFKEEAEIVGRFKGKELKGKKYKPLFPFFADRAKEGASPAGETPIGPRPESRWR